MKHAFPTLLVLEIPQMFILVIFEDIGNGRQSFAYLWGLQYLKGRKCNFRDKGELIHDVVFKQLMWVSKLAWPSLIANPNRIYGKFSRITLYKP